MELLGGCFILVLLAAFAAWFMPDVLGTIEAHLHARRDALRVQKMAFVFHLAKVKGER